MITYPLTADVPEVVVYQVVIYEISLTNNVLHYSTRKALLHPSDIPDFKSAMII